MSQRRPRARLVLSAAAAHAVVAAAAVPRALAADERQAMLDTLHSERFVDQSPAEVHATLLEEQTYLGSVRTMYRVLAEAHEVRERRAQARHPVYTKPELVATGPESGLVLGTSPSSRARSRTSTTRSM